MGPDDVTVDLKDPVWASTKNSVPNLVDRRIIGVASEAPCIVDEDDMVRNPVREDSLQLLHDRCLDVCASSDRPAVMSIQPKETGCAQRRQRLLEHTTAIAVED